MPESGNKYIEIAALTTIIISAGFFCWFLWAEHKDNSDRNETIRKLQNFMYEKMVVMDLDQRFNDGP